MRSNPRPSWLLAGVLLAIPSAPVLHAQQPAPAPDTQLNSDVGKALRGKQFRGVQSQVANGVITLTGEVSLYGDKADAEKRVARLGATSVDDRIKVDAPPGISDEQLFRKLGKTLAYQRIGTGDSLPFNSITLQIKDGVATLGGLVVNPPDKEAAITSVVYTPGIRGLVDHLQVAPPSPNDWTIRRAEYRAIYGATQLTRYAIDPAKPIRIVVLNGHVVLTGLVQTKADRDFAGLRANGVPGVFSVTNDLQYEGQNNGPDR